MSADILITWSNTTEGGSWSVASGGVALGNPLESAVLVSLFTDRVAPIQPSSLDQSVGIGLPGQNGNDRRGWWGDAYATVPIGSRLWQLARLIKANASAALAEVEDVCGEALQWLIDDGVAQTVTAKATWIAPTLIGIAIAIQEPGSNTPTTFSYSWAWEGL